VPSQRRAAAADLQALFVSDCTIEFTNINGHRYDGHAGIMELFGETLAGAVAWMAHYFCNPVIEIEDDRASAYWLLYAASTPRTDPKAPPKITYGRYQDSYRRTPTRWAQTELRVSNETPATANPFVRAQP